MRVRRSGDTGTVAGMDSTVITAGAALTGAVIGAAAGAFGGPWTQWSIEKRRDRGASRRAMVLEWRLGIAQMAREAAGDASTLPEFGSYRDTDWYQSLHGYLADPEGVGRGPHQVLKPLDGVGPGRVETTVDRLRAEVDRLERKWKLV